MQEELPPYDPSPLPGYITTGDLASPVDTVSLLSHGSHVGGYNYKSDHLHINLGPRVWGTRLPVYGFQGIVEGTVRFAKKCSHVVSVTTTVSLQRSPSLSAQSLTRLTIPTARGESDDHCFPRWKPCSGV